MGVVVVIRVARAEDAAEAENTPPNYTRDGITVPGTIGSDKLLKAWIGDRGQDKLSFSWTPTTTSISIRAICTVGDGMKSVRIRIGDWRLTEAGCVGDEGWQLSKFELSPDASFWLDHPVGKPVEVSAEVIDVETRKAGAQDARIAIGIFSTKVADHDSDSGLPSRPVQSSPGDYSANGVTYRATQAGDKLAGASVAGPGETQTRFSFTATGARLVVHTFCTANRGAADSIPYQVSVQLGAGTPYLSSCDGSSTDGALRGTLTVPSPGPAGQRIDVVARIVPARNGVPPVPGGSRLGVGIYFLIKYWDEVSSFFVKTWDATWGWLKDMWSKLWNGIKDAALAVWNFLTHGWGQTLLLFMGPIGLIIAVATHWEEIWNAIKLAATTVWDALKTAWSATVDWILSVWNAAVAPIMEAWNTVWPEMKQAAQNVWDVLKAAWQVLWTGMKIVWDAFWSLFGPSFKAGWEGLTATASAAWDLLKAAWQLVWSVIQGVYQTGWALLSGAWKIGWTVLTETAKIAWAILTGAWQVIWSVVTGIWNTFYATFSAIFSAAWNTIVTIVQGIWNVIKAAWDALWKTITAIFMTFLAIFTGNWSGAWNAIKDAAMAIWNLIKTAWQAFLNVLKSLLDGFINIVKAAWSAFWTAVQATATTFWNALRNLFQTFLTAVTNLWNTAWTAIKNFFLTLLNSVITIAQNFWTTLRNLFNTGLEFLKALWNTVWTTIRTLFTTAVNGLVTTATGLWTSIRQIFSAGSEWLRTTFWNPVANFFTKTIPSAFEAGVKALGTAWDKIKKLVRDPIQAVVNVVYNNGIVKLWNMVAGVFSAPKLNAFTLPAFAAGGSTGKGPGKSSRGFPALLHPDEHVWTAAEVAGAGGHEAVARMRSQALRGERVRVQGNKYGNRSFDDGGGLFGTGFGPDVGPDLVPDGIIKNAYNKLKDVVLGGVYKVIEPPVNAAVKLAQSTVRGIVPGSGSGIEKLGESIPRKMGDVVLAWIKDKDVAPTVAGGSVEGALTWARSQVGKPYQWGGVGPAGYDCSGFMGAIQNVIMGKKPNTRVWATAAFSGATAPSGWKQKEKAPFMVGITNAGVGHTAGTLNGVNVESSGGVGVRVGGGARGYNNGMFTSWYGFLPSKNAGGSSASAAKAAAKGMLGQYGWGAQWADLEALWTRESGWNYKATNPSSGAYGIPQALPGSKMASAGKDWKTNASTQIRWGLSYIKSRYGSPAKANAFQKANNWYGYGTRSAAPGWGVVGDRGIELMKMRGGERIEPLESLVKETSGAGVNLTLHIDARGATAAAVERLENQLPDKLRMALEQGTGKRP